MSGQLYSMKEAASALQTSERTLARWLKSGKLQAHKIRGKWQITREELERRKCKSVNSDSSVNTHDKQDNNANYDIQDIIAMLNTILDACPTDGPQWKIVIDGAINGGADNWLGFLLDYRFPKLGNAGKLELAQLLQNGIEGQKLQLGEVVDDPVEAENIRHELNLKSIAINQAIERHWQLGDSFEQLEYDKI